jgi:hypothetical protein
MIGLNRSFSLAYSGKTRRDDTSFQANKEVQSQELMLSRYYQALISLGSRSMSMSCGSACSIISGWSVSSTLLLLDKEIMKEEAATICPRAVVQQESRKATKDDMRNEDDGAVADDVASISPESSSQPPAIKTCMENVVRPKPSLSSPSTVTHGKHILLTTKNGSTKAVTGPRADVLTPKEEKTQLPLSPIVKHISNHTLVIKNGSTMTTEGKHIADQLSEQEIESITSRPIDPSRISNRGAIICTLAVGGDRTMDKVHNNAARVVFTHAIAMKKIKIGLVILIMVALTSLYSIYHGRLGHSFQIWRGFGANMMTGQVIMSNNCQGLLVLEEIVIQDLAVQPFQRLGLSKPLEVEAKEIIVGSTKPASFKHSFDHEWFVLVS